MSRVSGPLIAGVGRTGRDRGAAAAALALDEQTSVPAAIWRNDFGWVTQDFGMPGDPMRRFRGGWGLSHIVAKRTAEGLDGDRFVREVLPNILAMGRLHRLYGPPAGRRADIVLANYRATLSLMRNGKRETWLLTAYEIK